MNEYGGYIELEYFHGRPYHEDALALNSGRHCLEYLLRAKGILKLWLPRFLCASVSDTCRKCGVEVGYYGIGPDFLPDFSQECTGDIYLYVVNFYGQLDNACLARLKARHNNLIVDNAQAFFQMPVPGVDTLYTCRKFFGVADGGYLYSDAGRTEDLEQDVSYDRMEYLLGRLEMGANAFYSRYAANNKRFAGETVKRMSRLTENLLRGIDYERAKRIRTENFAALHQALGARNQLKLTVPEGAFMYPLYLPEGAKLRKKLQAQKIYVPTLWPDVFSLCGEDDAEFDMANNILPLPVDQRYGKEDMEYIVQQIRCCAEEV